MNGTLTASCSRKSFSVLDKQFGEKPPASAGSFSGFGFSVMPAAPVGFEPTGRKPPASAGSSLLIMYGILFQYNVLVNAKPGKYNKHMTSFTKYRSRLISSVVIIAACLFMSSCSDRDAAVVNSSEEETTANQTVNYGMIDTGPQNGGVLRLPFIQPGTFNPLLADGVFTKEALSFIYEPLVKTGPDLQPVPWLAKAWSVSEDGIMYTFELRDGIYWHDGMPFTTADVEYSFRMIKDSHAKSPYYFNIENIKTISAIDRLHFKIILDRPDSFTPEAMDFPVIPSHIRLSEGLSQEDFKRIAGTGPFEASQYIEGQTLLLERNTHWWASNDIFEMGFALPYLDGVEFSCSSYIDDPAGSFQTHDIDIAFLNNEESGKFSGRTDITSRTYTGNEYEFLALNTSAKLLEDPVLRQCISMMIDREYMVEGLFAGKATAAEFPILPGSWLGKGREAEREINDPAAIDKALKDNGWKTVKQRLYKTINGQVRELALDLIVNNENEDRKRIAGYISNVLKEHMINVNIVGLEWKAYMSALVSGKYDLALAGCKVRSIPDVSFMYHSLSVKIGTSGYEKAWNIAGYANPDVDEYLGKIRDTDDNSARIVYFSEIRRIIEEDVPYIGLFFYNNTALYAKKVRGVLEPYIWDRYNDISRWYIVK